MKFLTTTFRLTIPRRWRLKNCAGSSRFTLIPSPLPPLLLLLPRLLLPGFLLPLQLLGFQNCQSGVGLLLHHPQWGGTTSRPNHPPEPQPPKLPRWGYLLSLHMSTICVIWELCMLTVQRVSARDSSKPGWRCPLRDTDWVIDRIEETWPFSLTNPKNSNSKDRRSF